MYLNIEVYVSQETVDYLDQEIVETEGDLCWKFTRIHVGTLIGPRGRMTLDVMLGSGGDMIMLR